MKDDQEKVKGLISLLKPQEPTVDECEKTCEKVTLENIKYICEEVELENILFLFFCRCEPILPRDKVEKGREPSVQCHQEKLADVCTSQYKETTVRLIQRNGTSSLG